MGKAHSLHLVFPTRMNIERLLTGRSRFISQFPEGTGGREVEFENIIRFDGHPGTVPFKLAPIPRPR